MRSARPVPRRRHGRRHQPSCGAITTHTEFARRHEQGGWPARRAGSATGFASWSATCARGTPISHDRLVAAGVGDLERAAQAELNVGQVLDISGGAPRPTSGQGR
ncbi:MAG: hypothetical protein R2713_11340 [Ilumatobacteraceae bacterium]